jgi:hypothetical protein
VTAPGVFTPYSTLNTMFPATKPTWIPDVIDQQRIMSYQIYEEIFENVPSVFKLVARGRQDKPIYIPTAKTIINTTNRYVAPKMGFMIAPKLGETVSQEEIMVLTQFWQDFFKRERFYSQLNGNKRYGLVRGDWLWHITADPRKLPGSRLTIRPIDPGSYFPIWHPDDVDKVIGCHIVEQMIPPGEKDTKIKRLTYRKSETPGGSITVEEAWFKLDDWEGPKSKPDKIIQPLRTIAGITNLPVYHVKNTDEPGNPFGSSEIRGLERIMAAINQAISDEDIALAIEGIGIYATDAPPPKDLEGNITDWVLGPGRMLEHPPGAPGSKGVYRVSGVGSVGPYQDHLAYLERQLKESSNTPDVAVGKVDVTVAQSGIALRLQLGPMLSKAEEKDQTIVDVHDQMFYDLATEWFPVFEQANFDGTVVSTTLGDKIPVDRTGRLQELNDMLDRQVISTQYYRDECTKLGYVFPDDIEQEIQADADRLAAAVDPFGARVDQELGEENGEEG